MGPLELSSLFFGIRTILGTFEDQILILDCWQCLKGQMTEVDVSRDEKLWARKSEVVNFDVFNLIYLLN